MRGDFVPKEMTPELWRTMGDMCSYILEHGPAILQRVPPTLQEVDAILTLYMQERRRVQEGVPARDFGVLKEDDIAEVIFTGAYHNHRWEHQPESIKDIYRGDAREILRLAKEVSRESEKPVEEGPSEPIVQDHTG